MYVIAVTANAMEGDREKCELAGMDDYVSKPLRPADLVAALERALQRSGAVAPGSGHDAATQTTGRK